MWEIFQELRGQPLQGPRELARSARARLHTLRDRGEVRLWKMQTRTLTRVGEALSHSPELPVVGKLSDAAEGLVQRRLDALKASPIAGFDQLNAKDAARAARDVKRRVELLALREVESAGKKRKTVLDAIDETLARLDRVAAPREPAPQA